MSVSAGFSRLIYFGDSLTDQGRLFDLTSQVLSVPFPFASEGYDGRFSDGRVYSQIVPGLLGIEDVDNFAFGAARAVGVFTLEEYFAQRGLGPLVLPDASEEVLAQDLNLGGQLAEFLSIDQIIQPGTAVSLLIGVNDYAALTALPDLTPQIAQATLQQTVAQTIGTATSLAQIGVETVIVNTLPTTSFFPLSQFLPPETVALGNQILSAHNDALEAGVAGLVEAGIDARIVDLGAMADEVVADPLSYGFSAPLDAFVVTPAGANPLLAGFDPDQIAFFDPVHPTEALHGVFAAFSAASLTSDVQILGDGDDRARGGREHDLVLGGDGDDRINLRQGDDVAIGGLGNDRIWGGRGEDILSGGAGNDRIFGGQDADVLAGGAGADFLLGAGGDDLIILGGGSNMAVGGSGDDTFVFVDPELTGHGSAGWNFIVGSSGYDRLYLVTGDEAEPGFEPISIFGATGLSMPADRLFTVGIEEVIYLEDRSALADIDTPARLEEADLWGLL